jgi:adenylate kinase
MDEHGHGPVVVVDVVVPDEELVKRLAGRRICANCGANADPSSNETVCRKCGGEMVQRADDSQGVVLERLKVYARATKPVLDYYRGRPTFRAVNGAQPLDVVAREIDAQIDDARRGGR